jgi:hypothetical protein
MYYPRFVHNITTLPRESALPNFVPLNAMTCITKVKGRNLVQRWTQALTKLVVFIVRLIRFHSSRGIATRIEDPGSALKEKNSVSFKP